MIPSANLIKKTNKFRIGKGQKLTMIAEQYLRECSKERCRTKIKLSCAYDSGYRLWIEVPIMYHYFLKLGQCKHSSEC